ncbi:MAG: LETM1-related biofilm-associated protein [Flavobacterium sp.]
MNPSVQGWVKLFLSDYSYSEMSYMSHDELYKKLREFGFVYGFITGVETSPKVQMIGWLEDEKTKLALLNALFKTFKIETKSNDSTIFLVSIIDFYNEIQPESFNWFKKILPSDSNFLKLEKKIDNRVKTNLNLVSKNFSNLITNALLFLDVLAYRRFLKGGTENIKYMIHLEEKITSVVWSSLSSKSIKSDHDDALLKLFESSLRFSRLETFTEQYLIELLSENILDSTEKIYLMDIACMAIWSDKIVENKEYYFIQMLGKSLKLEEIEIQESLSTVENFILKNQKSIPYFNASNPVKTFYDQTSIQVITLVSRNKKRIIKELVESKELMVLLTHATQRELTGSEKKKMKKQLLDLCKSIPALTIFLLPGGSILLPLLVKFIPQLLPSAFNENLK